MIAKVLDGVGLLFLVALVVLGLTIFHREIARPVVVQPVILRAE